jgi:hypothetical protein
LTLGFGQSHWFAFLNIMLPVVGLVLAMLVLALIYRRIAATTQRSVLPRASAATNLWWRLTLIFGIYVRKMQFGLLYGTLAAGDPCDGVDGVVRYDHLSWRVVERRSNERRSGSGLTRHPLQPSLEQYLAVVRYSAGKNPMPLLQLLGVLIGAGILLWMVNRFIWT